MARSYAPIYHRIWADPEWRALNVDAQHLYLLLISQPQMNMAGVLPLQPRKWASCVQGWTAETATAALDALTTARYTVVDEDTEEVLVRSLIRNDCAYKTPGMLKSILKFAEATQGPDLRSVLAVELGRLGPLEGKTAADGMAAIAATRLVLMPQGTPPGPGVVHSSDGIGDGIRDAFVGTHPGYVPQTSSEPIGDTSGTGSGTGALLSLVGSVVGGGRSPAPGEPPRCKRHADMDPDEIPPCRRCGQLREEWEVQCTAAANAKPKRPRWCGACDERTRMVEVGRGMGRCPNCHPLEARKAANQ